MATSINEANDIHPKHILPFFLKVKDGLFCERIFGPMRDWECYCGKYKRIRFKGIVCDKCGVEVTLSKVRRERMGHIALAVPLINPLYLNHVCTALSHILNVEDSEIRSLIYYQKFIVFGEENEKKLLSFIDKNKFLSKKETYKDNEPLIGALAIQELIANHISSLDTKKHNLVLENVIVKHVLVIPPNLRPIARLGNKFLGSDLNHLYRKVINRNDRFERLIALSAPEYIILNEGRMLQEAIDELSFGKASVNSTKDKSAKSKQETHLRSLSETITQLKYNCSTLLDMLLRRSLDYTAQTRITVEHTGDIDLAFLPKSLAYELFSPFIIEQPSYASKLGSISNVDETVDNNINNGEDTSSLDCSKFVILMSTSSSSSRFIALRFQLTHDLTLKVHSGVMDLLGWELLGKSARIFALFSNEAIEEALSTLTPSRLVHQKAPTVVSDSALDIAREAIIPFISTKALSQESVPIGPYEWLLTMPFRYPKKERLANKEETPNLENA